KQGKPAHPVAPELRLHVDVIDHLRREDAALAEYVLAFLRHPGGAVRPVVPARCLSHDASSVIDPLAPAEAAVGHVAQPFLAATGPTRDGAARCAVRGSASS